MGDIERTDSEVSGSGATPFERIRLESEEGYEYWSARDLGEVLGYKTNYRNFKNAIQKAMVACETSGQDVADHFAEARKLIQAGKGAQREIEDMHLSRYACYLVVQNADPSKPLVALGQTYFAVQTRRQEQADELAGLTEDRKRLFLRGELATRNRLLADAASHAGVVQPVDFAIFQDHGYMGLYGGLKSRDIHKRKGLKPSQQILDHMGSTELAANLFRATQTDEKLRREGIRGKAKANQTHYEVGRKVRQTIEELGGTPPEELPTPSDSIKQLKSRVSKGLSEGPQMPLLAEGATPE
jgi:DNA-damage-inducible protein D